MAWSWGEATKGGAGGAMTGAAIGSVVPGIGTLAGAGVGALAGGLLGGWGGGDPNQGYRDDMAAYGRNAGGRDAPQLGPAAQAAYSGFRGNQRDLVSMLEAQSRGQGPSLAGMQLQAGMEQAGRQSQSLAAGARGPSAGMAQFQAMNNMGMMGAQTNQQAAMARIQEQFNAQNLLGLTLHGARGQDEAMNQYNTDWKNRFSETNLKAKMDTTAQNDWAFINSMQGAGNMQRVPTMGDQLLAGGANAGAMAMMGMGGGGGGTGMSRIAAGYPGAGGYFTPQQPPRPTGPYYGPGGPVSR